MDPEVQTFSSRRALVPMMAILLCIGTGEMIVAHFLLALWSPRGALLMSLVTVPALTWLLAGIASLRTMPSRLEARRLILRAGRMKGVTLPLAQVAGVRGVTGTGRGQGILNLALIAHPNVLVDLSPPLERYGRRYDSLAHRLDDPAAFVAALVRLGVPA